MSLWLKLTSSAPRSPSAWDHFQLASWVRGCVIEVKTPRSIVVAVCWYFSILKSTPFKNYFSLLLLLTRGLGLFKAAYLRLCIATACISLSGKCNHPANSRTGPRGLKLSSYISRWKLKSSQKFPLICSHSLLPLLGNPDTQSNCIMRSDSMQIRLFWAFMIMILCKAGIISAISSKWNYIAFYLNL